MFEKVTIITLLYLTTLGDIKQESFEVVSGDSCESWFHHNVRVVEKKKRKLFSRYELLFSPYNLSPFSLVG